MRLEWMTIGRYSPYTVWVRSILPISVALLLAGAVKADEVREYEFDIPSQNIEAALNEFAKQADSLLLFPYDLVQPVSSKPVKGKYPIQVALEILLKDSGLAGGLTEGGVITISRAVTTERPEGNSMTQYDKSEKKTKTRGLLGALVAFFSMSAVAQDTDSTANVLEEVIVTGSRIARSDFVSTSPVTTLGSDAVEVRGITRVEDLVQTLPQAYAGQNATSGINSGTATVNLRGLGAERTLVLIDGKRLPYGSPVTVAADLNQVPAQLVERVEVLTGGASAVYGADAIAGVVNFIMKRDFEGLEFNIQGSFYNAGNNNSTMEAALAAAGQPDPGSANDGQSMDFSVLFGGNLNNGKGNITGYFNYTRDESVRWEDRDISACPLGTANSGTEFSCAGSSSMPLTTRFTRSGQTGSFNLTVDPATSMLRPYTASTDQFNYSNGNYLQRPRERFVMGTSMHYELNPKVEWFMNYSYVENSTKAQIAPGGLSLGRTSSVNCDNPLLSAEQLSTFCNPEATYVDSDGVVRAPLFIGHRNVEGGPRSNEYETGTHSVVTGFRGDILEGWNYEIFGQYSKGNYNEKFENDVVTDKAALALDVVTDPVTGMPVCRAALTGVAPDCVPWDIYQPGNVSQAAAEYIATTGIRTGHTELTAVGGSVTGDLGSHGWIIPWADTGVQVVFGFEYRKDYLELTPDISNGPSVPRDPVSGSVEVWELFTEAQVPLVQDKPLMKDLSLHGAYRYSDYFDTTGTQSTYSGGVTWNPIDGVLVRTQYQRATRAPNPIELFSDQSFGRYNQSSGVNGLYDPCSGDFDPNTPVPEPAASLEECSHTGVTQAQYGQIIDSSTGEFDTLRGGNPDLDPEVSDTWTAGIVVTPRSVPALHLSLDYFSIDVQGFIGTIPPELALSKCLSLNDPIFCNLINRDEYGSLWLVDEKAFIQATLINTGKLKTQGIDIGADYAFDLDNWGTLKLRYIATLLDEYTIQSIPGEDTIDCAGYYSGVCGPPRPDYRHSAYVDWLPSDKWSVAMTWRFVGSSKQYGNNPAPVNAKLDSTSFFDVFARYDISEHWQLRAGINNIFDQDPPLTSVSGAGGDSTSGRGNTYPQIYDAQGRFIFAGIRASFL